MSKEKGLKSNRKQGKPMDEARPVEKRWNASRKQEAVLRLLRGEALDSLSRELGVEAYRLVQWRDRALVGIDASLRERHTVDARQLEREAALKRRCSQSAARCAAKNRRGSPMIVCVLVSPRARFAAENLLLRQQLVTLPRGVRRPKLKPWGNAGCCRGA